MLTIDRQKYAEEIGEPVELLDPIPQLAPARNGVALLPFQLALPNGKPKQYYTAFVLPCDFPSGFDSCAVRYGEMPPVYLNLSPHARYGLMKGDVLGITLTQS